jgi:hypothetical protein
LQWTGTALRVLVKRESVSAVPAIERWSVMSRQGDLFDVRMADGSRHFAEVPWRPPLVLKQRLLETPGVRVTALIESVAEAWIDFEYAGRAFSAHNPLNDFWLFVRDPGCPEGVLREVTAVLA